MQIKEYLLVVYNFNLSQISLGSGDRIIVFQTPEAETIKLGDLTNFISVLSRVDLLT